MKRPDYPEAIYTKLLGDFRLGALVRNWEDCLGSLGFRRGYLVLFAAPGEKGGIEAPAISALITAARSPSTEGGMGIERREFPSAFLLPPELDQDWGGAGRFLEPLVYRGESLGYLLVESGTEDPKARETLRSAMSAAVKAALLMEEVRRNEEVLEVQVQEASNRTLKTIAQDIHDDLCQDLAGISMLAAVAEESLAGTGSVSLDSIREIRAHLESAVDRSRRLARSLDPPGLEEFGLAPALEDLIESLGRSSGGIALSFRSEGDCRIEDPAIALQLYRIIREALTNAIRHSGSDAATLSLKGKEGRLVAEVRDFGRGLPPDYMGRGMGMRIMRSRAASMGARLEIGGSDPGVCVSCAVDP